MNKNHSSNHPEPEEKSPAQFKLSLFSSSSDVWILAIALLILLIISFVNEREIFPPSLKQIPDQSENNILTKNISTGIYTTMAEEKTGIIRKKNADREINKSFFGLG